MNETKRRQSKSLLSSAYSKAEVSPGFLLWKTFQTWQRLVRSELERLDLTQAQYSILAAVSYLGSTEPAVSQQDIVNQLSMDKMMVSDVVRTLVSKKLLNRTPHPSDRRAFSLELTLAAKDKLKKAVPAVEATDEIFFGRLGSKELRQFIALLINLNNSDQS